jgi:hypothetical protein
MSMVAPDQGLMPTKGRDEVVARDSRLAGEQLGDGGP